MKKSLDVRNEGTGVANPGFASVKGSALKKRTRDDNGHKLSHIAARERLEKKDPSSKGHIGVSKKGLYRHNPETGFSENVHARTGKFTGKDAY